MREVGLRVGGAVLGPGTETVRVQQQVQDDRADGAEGDPAVQDRPGPVRRRGGEELDRGCRRLMSEDRIDADDYRVEHNQDRIDRNAQRRAQNGLAREPEQFFAKGTSENPFPQ